MRLNYIPIVLFVVISWASCTSTRYVSDSLQKLDPSKYQSYVMEDNCGDEINPIMQIRIKNALEKKLRSSGYTQSPNADVLVKYFVKNMSKKYVEECTDEYQRWEGGQTCQERVVTYMEGSIVLDVIDTRTNTIIWHGAAFGPSWSSIRDPNKKVDEVMDVLLERYFNP